MTENIHGLHLVPREAVEPRITSVRRSHQATESVNTYLPPKTRLDDISTAFRAMEQRLAVLIEDRGRLTRDLHDSVLQSLYAIGLGLETARRSSPQNSADTGRSGDLVVGQLNRLIQEVRVMIRSLESGNVQEFDLELELRLLVSTYKRISPLRIRTDLAPRVVALATNEEKREVLMIVREAVSNCVRHARAAQATVSLYARGTHLRLLIADDGVGFAHEESRRRGYGLANMAARAKKLGGRLLVRSQIGKGTRILVEFSLEPGLSSA